MNVKYQKGEFITIPNKSAIRGLEPTLQVIFLWLCDHSDDTMQSFPSRKTLAAECGVSIRTFDRGMQELVNKGFIVKSARYNGTEQTTNLYEVVIFAQSSDNSAGGGVKSALGGDKNSTQNSTHLTQPIELNTITNVIVSAKANEPTVSDFFYLLVTRLGFSEQVRFTAKRHDLLKRRLKTFKPSEIVKAADAIATDPYLQGDNPSGRRYGDIDYLLRSDEQVDKFLQTVEVKLTGGAF